MVDKYKNPDIRKPMWFGIAVLCGFVVSFIIWAAVAPLQGAAIADGKVVVDSYKKTIQHLEGGIIEAIYVKNGELVKQGQPLLKLDNVKASSQINSHFVEHYALKAKQARLLAERDNKPIVFSEQLLINKNKPDIAKIIEDQTAIYQDNQSSFREAIYSLDEKLALNQQQIQSINERIIALQTQQIYLHKEIVAVEELLEKHYVEKTRYWRLKREDQQMRSQLEELHSQLLKTKQDIEQAKLDKMKVANDTKRRILSELHETHTKLEALRHQVKNDQDVLDRTLIIAPLTGTVMNLAVHTLGGVIKPGEPLLDIVPNDDKLIAEVRVNPIDIDDIYVGMEAKIKLMAYSQRTTPDLKATVTYISADSITDKNTGQSYYLARVAVDADQLKKLKNVKLFPGMPVQAFIHTKKTTFLNYLLNPITNSFDRAFREN